MSAYGWVGLGMGLSYFAEVHALDAFAAQGWADGGGGRGLPGADDEFDDLVGGEGFARHFVLIFYALYAPAIPVIQCSKCAISYLG